MVRSIYGEKYRNIEYNQYRITLCEKFFLKSSQNQGGGVDRHPTPLPKFRGGGV